MKLLLELYKTIDENSDGAVTLQELHRALVSRSGVRLGLGFRLRA